MNPAAKVFLVSLWLGIVSFGGGLAIVPEMHRQFVELNGWVDAREFADGYALAQLSPGPNMLCVVFYGYEAAGLLAALLAPVAIVTPGVALSAVCGRAWSKLASNVWLVRLRRGLVPVGLGLMAGGVFVVGRTTITSWPLALVALVVTTVVNRRLIHPALAVVAAGVVGVLMRL
ncbi:MAG TPA: chromate transporter [Polyangiaceae bacterium]